jgi:hypothetical protein
MLSLVNCKETPSNVEAVALTEPPAVAVATKKVPLKQDFKEYWYNGEAEITSFELSQERYGELRSGTAVLIYVTEDFLPEKQVKADNYSTANVPVLKLNSTKKFNTGIYPYSIMESTFYPVGQETQALKVSASIQEWCGQVYAQINNSERFEVRSHSYFETEADQEFELDKSLLENEIWNIIRIDPDALPVGDLQMIPSLEFCRLRHQPIKAYEVFAKLEKGRYTLTYPQLERKLSIYFNPEFPYDIQGWEESNTLAFSNEPRTLTTKAKRMASMRTAYWSKNANSDLPLRDQLGLE